MAEDEEKTCCDSCCTKTILDKIDKQNFINMNYQNENDNSFNTLISKAEELQKSVDKLSQMLQDFQGENDNSFTDILNWINKEK